MKIQFVVLIVILLSTEIITQINPSEFPKIGFADMYWLKKNATYGNSNQIDYSDSSYYYPALQELGLTSVVSYTDPIPLNPNFNTSIKILDTKFPRSSYWSYNKPFKYALSAGNNTDHFPYEAGGQYIALLTSEDHKFGFGNNVINNAASSWWIYPFNNQCIGNKNFIDGSATVHFAQLGDTPGVLLRAELEPNHQPYNEFWGHQFNYKIKIRARIDGDAGQVNVAKVRIWEDVPPEPFEEVPSHRDLYRLAETGENPPTLTDYTYYITADDFNGVQYIDLVSPDTFKKTQGRSSRLYVTIEWLGTRNLYIDNISIYNTWYEDLFILNSQSVRNEIKNDLDGLFGSVKNNPLFLHPYNDEPWPIYYRGVGEVSNLSEEELGTGKYVNGATMGLTNDMLMFANSQRRLPYVLYDLYPITENTSTGSTGDDNIQNAFDNLINDYVGSPGYGVQRYRGLRSAIEMAQNYTPENPNDDVPFYHTIQVQAEKRVQNGIWRTDLPRFRAPTYQEILAQGNLALCYGVKGIMYFLIMTDTPNSGNGNIVTAYYGLFEQINHQGDVIQNPAEPQTRNYRYWAVKELNESIGRKENELLSLTWGNAYSIHLGQPTDCYILNVQSYDEFNLQDPPENTFVELGLFKKTIEYTNDYKDDFLIVNRRTLYEEGRIIRVNIDKSGAGNWNNWGITEIGTANTWTIGETGQFETNYEPGEGKLFRLEPVVMGGGRLTNNETINNNIELHGDLYIEENVSLTVNSTYDCYGNIYLEDGGHIYGSGTINLHDGKELIVSGNPTVLSGSSPANKLTIDFITTSNNSGIFVESSGYLSMQNTIVNNSGVGLSTGRDFDCISIVNVDFNDCGDEYYAVNLTGPSTQRPWISGCTFNNCYGALLATNLSEIVVQNNQITNCDAGIDLSNIPQPYIIGNILTSDKKTMPGIFLSSCNGITRSNLINGHTNGIHLANSSPDLGGNFIDNNLYHGLYIGAGSLPDMHAELFTGDPGYYAISGYNTIIENGGFTTGSPPDNDGSEIFFGSTSANADLREGCNSITDNREPGMDRPPYNTQLLMNSSISLEPITVYAGYNYWGENPLYSLEKRFGNLNVYFNPVLTSPCEYSEEGGFLLVKTSLGDIVDTIRQVDKSVGILSENDILYSIAEGKFISGDYAEAKQIYNQVISSNDTLFSKLLAYQRLYEIGKITNENPAYFDNLNNIFNTYCQSTQDSLLQKRFSQLALLSLVGEEEYLSAIEEFDNIIELKPGTEEAVYAEIDALTTALLIEPEDSTLGKSAAKKYITNSRDYVLRINQLLKQNFGAKTETGKEIIPSEYSLYNNYPNPFNPTTVIRYDIPERTQVELVVYDILGRRIKSLLDNEIRNPGRYEVSFDANSLASGVYIYKLTTKSYSRARKMVLIR